MFTSRMLGTAQKGLMTVMCPVEDADNVRLVEGPQLQGLDSNPGVLIKSQINVGYR